MNATTSAPPQPATVLAISDREYAVSSGQPDHAPYWITILPDGSMTCTTTEHGETVPCPGFRFRGRCHHTFDVRAYRAATTPQPAPTPGEICRDLGHDFRPATPYELRTRRWPVTAGHAVEVCCRCGAVSERAIPRTTRQAGHQWGDEQPTPTNVRPIPQPIQPIRQFSAEELAVLQAETAATNARVADLWG